MLSFLQWGHVVFWAGKMTTLAPQPKLAVKNQWNLDEGEITEMVR